MGHHTWIMRCCRSRQYCSKVLLRASRWVPAAAAAGGTRRRCLLLPMAPSLGARLFRVLGISARARDVPTEAWPACCATKLVAGAAIVPRKLIGATSQCRWCIKDVDCPRSGRNPHVYDLANSAVVAWALARPAAALLCLTALLPTQIAPRLPPRQWEPSDFCLQPVWLVLDHRMQVTASITGAAAQRAAVPRRCARVAVVCFAEQAPVTRRCAVKHWGARGESRMACRE